MLTTRPIINRLLPQKRQIIPLIAAGIGILAVGTAAQYVVRTLKRMEEEKRNQNDNDDNNEKRGGNSSNNDSESDSDDHDMPKRSKSSKQMNFPKKSLGIDIGSSFSRISSRDGLLTEIIENKEGFRATSSTLFKTYDETSVGSFALRQKFANPSKVGYGYHSLVGLEPSNSIVTQFLSHLNVKDRMEPSHQEVAVDVGGTIVSASELYTHISNDLLATVQNKVENISSIPATISYPNYYNISQIKRAMLAIQQGGFHCRQYVPDSVAAIIGSHGRGHLPNEDISGKYAVLDIGGRITQLSVVEMTQESHEILSHRTVFDVGGEFMNDELAQYVANEFSSKHNISLLNDNFSKQRIYDAIETVKIDLSKTFSSKIDIPYITADSNGPKHLQMDITRAKLDHLISPMLQRLKDPFIEVLTEAKVSNSHHLKAFLLVGGGARVPLAQKISKEMIGLDPIIPSQPEEMTCVGSAIYSSKYQ